MKKNFTKLSIIIPAYNEAKTIHFILDKVKAVVLPNDIQKELIIVNDFSSDGTDKAIESYMNEMICLVFWGEWDVKDSISNRLYFWGDILSASNHKDF